MVDQQPFEMLVVDLDGTLLGSDGRVSRRNAEAVAAAEAAGLPVVVATGRSWRESRTALESIGYERPMIAAGGAVLADGGTGRTLRREAMPTAVVEEVVHTLLESDHPPPLSPLLLKDAPHGLDDYIVVGDRPLDPASEWWFRAFGIGYRRVDSLADDPHPEDTVRVGVVATGSALSTIARLVRDRVADRAMLQHWSAVTESEATGSTTHLLEIFGPRVSKWTMVETLCADLGVDPRRTIAIGDGLNDVELIAHAGLGIAMANACPEVLARADEVTTHHDEHGVSVAIERILEGRRPRA